MNDTRSKKEKNQHIQVFARVRPINNAEKTSKSSTLVEAVSSKEIIVRERPQDKIAKKFIFDKVFGPLSKQIDVYNAVVSPLLEEVLAGYNCTVFAYGQTGTGKTFTMEGVSNDPTLHWQSDTSAGIIPRALSHLFDELRMLEAQEYTVRVSFLELYNEELFDLLSPNDDASKIRLYEDASRKGAVIIHGLEEVTVHNKSEVYKILEKGSEKRQTAATLMNAHSSRSHTVFSITVHIKENTVEGEELLKTGKLNLVDLAGSENVGRSGAIDRRAREAGNINQSLLTLGRVITALVERAPHIPYRESKLTRLLQESLGGRTKTSIIATVSPASVNLEETLSTLDYAYRAKNITNRPEINQKLSKKALLKEYTEEIERLRRDLSATRERNGVYLAHENYNEMQALIEIQGREIEEKINHIKALEETMQSKEKIFNDLQLIHRAQTNELNTMKNVLHNTTNVLKSTQSRLVVTKRDLDEHKHLVEKHASTEQILYSQAETLLKVAETATTDTHELHKKIIRNTKVEEENENLREQFRSNISKRFQEIEKDLSVYTHELVQFCMTMKSNVETQTATQSRNIDNTIHHISKDVHSQEVHTTNKLSVDVTSSYEWYKKWLDNEIQNASRMTEHESTFLNSVSEKLAPRIQHLVQNGIVESLQTLNVHVCRRLEQLSDYTVEQINVVCNQLLANRDQVYKDVGDIRESLQTFLQSQNAIIHKRQQFAKMFGEMYDKFNDLNKCEEENAIALTNNSHHVMDICNDISSNAKSTYSYNVEKERSMQNDIQTAISHLKEDVKSGLEKNWTVAEQAASQSNMLIAELQTDLSNTCKELAKYKESVEQNARELSEKTDTDKETLLLSVENLRKIHTDASVNHIESMEQERNRIVNASDEIGHKFTNQSVEATHWTNRITAELRTTEHEVDKFLTEDIRRNIPTGHTPGRKEFQYPRELVKTSPHERILQRFRETKKMVEDCTVNDEDETVIPDYTVCHQQDISPPTLPEISIISQLEDVTLCGTSTPNGTTVAKQTNSECTIYHYDSNCMIKSASTSDLSAISRPSLEISVQSEPETYTKNNNKENGDDEFVKPDNAGVKRLSKLKCPPNRRVLGTHN